MSRQLPIFEDDVIESQVKAKVVNVSSVPQRSPFRYPGGKTWLIPTVRKWLMQDGRPASTLIEPFAGGGIVSLTAAFEKLAESVFMTELDPEIAAVWETILSEKNQWLSDKILNFNLSIDNALKAINMENKTVEDSAFSTIVKNRIYHGGIITKGSGPLKKGENGKGIASRWYPETLYKRITDIQKVRNKISFAPLDAFDVLEQFKDRKDYFFFIDPPYTKAGKRLYTFFSVDHEKLFAITAKLKGRFMLTYDDTPEIRGYAEKYNLPYKTIPMKTTHHLEKNEIIVSDNLNW